MLLYMPSLRQTNNQPKILDQIFFFKEQKKMASVFNWCDWEYREILFTDKKRDRQRDVKAGRGKYPS
jgi:hypothetical protein